MRPHAKLVPYIQLRWSSSVRLAQGSHLSSALIFSRLSSCIIAVIAIVVVSVVKMYHCIISKRIMKIAVTVIISVVVSVVKINAKI